MVMESRKTAKSQTIEHRHVPMLGGKYYHIYPRGSSRTKTSLRLPDPLLENIEYLSEVYGLQKWAVISLAISAFVIEQDL